MGQDSYSRRRILQGTIAGGTLALAGCQTSSDGDGGGGDGTAGGSTQTTTSQQDVTLRYVYQDSYDQEGSELASRFSEANSGITVETQRTSAESASTRDFYVSRFTSSSASFDIGNMDVIWPGEFVSNEWIAELSDLDGVTDNMLDRPVEVCTVDGSLYGMPLFTDANALYYRSDVLEEHGHDPPETMQELIDIAQDVKEQSDEIDHGYIWQGNQSEGLTIMWLNWLWSMGGSVRQDGNLVVNSETGVDALVHARKLIHEHGVSPEVTLDEGTDADRQRFQEGNTLFMRNWPYAIGAMSNADEDPLERSKFDVTSLPHAEGMSDVQNSCLGGWNLFVNGFSQKTDTAEQFLSYMGSLEAQEYMALEHTRLPVREEVYDQNPDVDHLNTFGDILANRLNARPTDPQYPVFSEIFYTRANQALRESGSNHREIARTALDEIQSQVDEQVNA